MATRNAKTFPLDDPAAVDGDAGFIGVNARLAPETLPPGWVVRAENCEFRAGGLMTRRGLHCPVWGDLARAIMGGTPMPLFGAGVVRDPLQNVQGTLLAGASAIYFVRPGVPARALNVPETIAGPVWFAQIFERVIAFRAAAGGAVLTPWVWEGGVGLSELDRTDHADGTRPIPGAATAQAMDDRLLVPTEDGNNVDVSDIGDATRYGIVNRRRCDAGRSDRIVRIFGYTRDAALVFKDRSLFYLSGVSGTLSTLRADKVNAELGLRAAASVASTGGDVLFLGSDGAVYRVTQVVQERIQTAAEPVSQDIGPELTRRVNFAAATGAQGAVWDQRYWLALPVDGSAVNNSVWVYNLINNAWEGVHTFPAGVQLDRLTTATLHGEERLFATDFARGRQYLLGEDREDCLPSNPTAIGADVTLRACLAGSAGRKRWNNVEIATSEWASTWDASLVVDGVAEEATLFPPEIERDRTINRQAGRRRWDASNANDDHGAQGRDDYAVILDPALSLGSGIVLDREQGDSVRFAASEFGRTGQLRIRSTRGRLTIRGVQLEGTDIDRATVATT